MSSDRRFVISEAERRFLEDGVLQDFRNDGRSCLDYRPVTVETKVIPSAAGSSRVQTLDTDLLVAVKLDVMTAHPDRPTEGDIKVHIDCSASVSRDYAKQGGREFGQFLSSLITELCLNRSIVSRSELCLVADHYSWVVCVDVMVLNSGGNLLDAISLGIKAALADTIIPATQAYEEQTDETQSVHPMNFDVDDRPEMGSPFPSVQKIPVLVTVGQIRGRLVWDMTSEEESCAQSKVTAAVDNSGNCVGLHKTGQSVTELSAIHTILESSRGAGLEIHRKLNAAVSTTS